MSVKIGDKVKFLNDVGGGIVSSFLDKRTVNVLNEDGFEIPALVEHLIVIEKDTPISGFPGNDNAEVFKEETTEPKGDFFEEADDFYEKPSDEISVFYILTPIDPKNPLDCDVNAHLVNDSNYHMLFNYMVKSGNLFESRKTGLLEANTKIKIDSFIRQQLNDFPLIELQIIFYKKQEFVPKPTVHKELKINSIKFFKLKYYKDNDFFHEPSIVVPVVEENLMQEAIKKLSNEKLNEVVKNKEVISPRINKPKQFDKNANPAYIQEVVDLHIHELVEDEKGMSNREILDVQMGKFRNELEDAIKRRIKSVVFIHGVGNGVLKAEIAKELTKKYKKHEFQDASFKEYGYGATMVMIR